MSVIMDEARKRATALDQVWVEAHAAAMAGWAEVARLELVAHCEREPAIKGVRYETEYAYNDEGGYFISTSAYPLIADGEADFDREVDPNYSFSETFESFGHEVLAKLCGVDAESESGEVTLEQAKEMRF